MRHWFSYFIEYMAVFNKYVFLIIFLMCFICGCSEPHLEFIFETKIRVAEDIIINYNEPEYGMFANTVFVRLYGNKDIRSYVIFRKTFQQFIGEYPNPWVENDIVFELGESKLVTLQVLDSSNNILNTIFKYQLGKGIYSIKPFYVFNHLPVGRYSYNLQFGNVSILQKLDIIK